MVSVSVGVYQLDGFLGFHMDLLALCDGEISVLRRDTTLHYTVSHCGSTTLLNQAPHAQRARPVRSAGWGCSLLEVATTGNYSNIRRRSSFIYGSLGFILLLCFCSTATYYFGICCQFSSNFGLWFGEILAVTFGELCPRDTIYPLGLPQFYTLWP